MGNSPLVPIEQHRSVVRRISNYLKETSGTITRVGKGHVFGLPHKKTSHKLDLKHLDGIIDFNT